MKRRKPFPCRSPKTWQTAGIVEGSPALCHSAEPIYARLRTRCRRFAHSRPGQSPDTFSGTGLTIVSRNWLRDYIPFDAAPAEVGERLTLAGLYSEWIEEVGDDVAMDLEVTSNRADWLGHLGIAREISVLYGSDFSMPSPEIAELTEQTDTVTSVTNECEDLARSTSPA